LSLSQVLLRFDFCLNAQYISHLFKEPLLNRGDPYSLRRSVPKSQVSNHLLACLIIRLLNRNCPIHLVSGGDVSPSLYHLVQTLRTAVSHYNLVVERYTTAGKSKAADKSDVIDVTWHRYCGYTVLLITQFQVGANTRKTENLKRNCVDQLDAIYCECSFEDVTVAV